MSLVSKEIIKSRVVEPNHHTNTSCEFRINDFKGKILTNLRIWQTYFTTPKSLHQYTRQLEAKIMRSILDNVGEYLFLLYITKSL